MKYDLQKMTVREVIETEEFKENMRKAVDIELQTLTDKAYEVMRHGGRLSRSPLNPLMERNVFNADRMTELYMAILNKSLVGFAAAERAYISEVGRQVYNITIKQLQASNGL